MRDESLLLSNLIPYSINSYSVIIHSSCTPYYSLYSLLLLLILIAKINLRPSEQWSTKNSEDETAKEDSKADHPYKWGRDKHVQFAIAILLLEFQIPRRSISFGAEYIPILCSGYPKTPLTPRICPSLQSILQYSMG